MLDKVSPPGISASVYELSKTPALDGGSFLIPNTGGGYESLYKERAETINDHVSFSPNPNYERYLKMHKVFLGSKGAMELKEIHDSLKNETMPRYLVTAGWAAIEASLVKSSDSLPERTAMLDEAEICLTRALKIQQRFNSTDQEHLKEHDYPYRIALDLACMPLFYDIVQGNVRPETNRRVFEDCLNIAQANAVQMSLAKKAGDIQALGEHTGLAYECNALLAFNSTMSPTWFALPSMPRADSGYHHRNQTHDLLVINQKWGRLKTVTPVEIKSTVGKREKERYRALLVRGKMHLSVDGKYLPEYTLNSLTAVYEGTDNNEEMLIANNITERFSRMVRDYYAGEKLGELTCNNGVANFRDSRIVAARYPGLIAA